MATTDADLRGKVALVTGGAKRVGRAIALRLAQAGMDVAITCHTSRDEARAVVREIDGEDLIVIRHMVYISITYDHRVIDGALAGQALNALVQSLEKMNEKTVTL